MCTAQDNSCSVDAEQASQQVGHSFPNELHDQTLPEILTAAPALYTVPALPKYCQAEKLQRHYI